MVPELHGLRGWDSLPHMPMFAKVPCKATLGHETMHVPALLLTSSAGCGLDAYFTSERSLSASIIRLLHAVLESRGQQRCMSAYRDKVLPLGACAHTAQEHLMLHM